MNKTTSHNTPSINPSDGRSASAQPTARSEDAVTQITGNMANWAIQSASVTGTPNHVSGPYRNATLRKLLLIN